MIRINKYLSMCGVTSRRGAEALIVEERVTINNRLVKEQGVMIDEKKDVVRVDGTEVRPVDQKVFVLLNKPPMVMTTLHDPFKRRTVLHYLEDVPIRVYPVGRLDYDTEGVLLLTNDGDLAYRLAHPKYEVEKIYEARVVGQFTSEAAKQIEAGIELKDGTIGRAEVAALSRSKGVSKIRLVLREGRKREVKQLCKAVGHPVKQLRRVEFATITTHGLKVGKWRYLTAFELDRIKALVRLK